MARPVGTRNADFDDKRAALVRQARIVWFARGPGATFHEIATAVGVSVPTLKHYFTDRDGLFLAVLEEAHREGQRFIDDAAVPRSADARAAIAQFFEMVIAGWRMFGVGRIHAMGLAEGLGDPGRGRAYVTHVLEPTLDGCERLLGALVERGALPKKLDLRAGALALAGPVVLALLHQDALDGRACRPLDVPAFVRGHVDAWLAGYGSEARATEKRGRGRG